MQNNDTFLPGLTTSNLLNQRRFKDLYFSNKNNINDSNLVPFGYNDQTIIQYVNLSPNCIELLEGFKTCCDIYLIGLIDAILTTTKLDSAHVNTINSRANLAISLSKLHKEFNNLLNDCKSDINLAKQVYQLIHSISLLLKSKHINIFFQKIYIKSALGSEPTNAEILEWVDFVGKISLLSPSALTTNAGLRTLFLTNLPKVFASAQLIILLTDILYNIETLTTSCITIFKTLLKNLDNILTFDEKFEIFNHCKSNTIEQHTFYKTIYVLYKGLITYKENLINSFDISIISHQSVLLYTLNQLKDDNFYEYCNIIFTNIIISKGLSWIMFCHLIDYIFSKNIHNDILVKICKLLEKYSFSHYLLSPYISTKYATLKLLKSILKQCGNCKLIPDVKTLINSKNMIPAKCNESDDEYVTNLNIKNISKDDQSDITCTNLFKSEINNKTLLSEWFETLELYAINVGLDQIDFVKVTSSNLINGLETAHSKCLFICYLSELGFTIKLDDLTIITPNDFFRGDPTLGHSITQIVEKYWFDDPSNNLYPYILSYMLFASGLIDIGISSYWTKSLQSFYSKFKEFNIFPISDLFFLGATRPLESIVGVEFGSDKSILGLKCRDCTNSTTNNKSLLQELCIRIIWHLLSSHHLSCNCIINSHKKCDHEFNYSSIRCPNCDCHSNLLVLGNRFNLTLLKSRLFGAELLANLMGLNIQFEGTAQELWNRICKSLLEPRNYPSENTTNMELNITTQQDPQHIDTLEIDIPTSVNGMYNTIADLDIYSIDSGKVSSNLDFSSNEWKTLLEFAINNYTCDKSRPLDAVLCKIILLSSLVYLPNNVYSDVWNEWPAWPLHLPNIPGLVDIRSDWLSLNKEKLNLTLDNLYLQNEISTDLSLYDLNFLVPWYVGRLYWARAINFTQEYQIDHIDYITSKFNLSILGSTDWYYKFALGPLKILLASASTSIKFSHLSLQGILIYYQLLKKQCESKNQIFVGQSQLLLLLEYLFRLLNSGTKINSLYTIYLSESVSKVIHGSDVLFPVLTTLLLSKRTPNFDNISFFYPLWYQPKAMKQSRFFFLKVLSRALNATDRDVVKTIISKLHIIQLLHSFSILYDHLDTQIHQSIQTIVSRIDLTCDINYD